jgi:hypothetical protein
MAPLASRDRQILALQTTYRFITTTVVLGSNHIPPLIRDNLLRNLPQRVACIAQRRYKDRIS